MQRTVSNFLSLLLAGLIGVTVSQNATADTNGSRGADPSTHQTRADQLMELFELVLDRHVSPPTMQQMVQGAIVEACMVAGREVKHGLAREISETAGSDQLRLILQRELEGLPPGPILNHGHVLHHGLSSIGVVVTPRDTQRVNAQFAANRYVGIGIALMMSNGYPQMNAVVPGGPADQVGALDKDKIVSIDGKSTTDMRINEVIDLLRGEQGSQVEVQLQTGSQPRRTVTMTREVVPFTTVAEPIFSESRHTAGIKIERIAASNVQELRRISAKLPEDVTTVVLDLRTRVGADNLHYGELLGNALVDDDRIGWVRRGDRRPREIRAETGTLFNDRDLVVVTDNFSRGVVKWVAAALQDTGQAIVFGSVSAQSATVSEPFELSSGEFAVSMPVAQLSRGNGEPLTQTRAGMPVIRGMDVNPVIPVTGRVADPTTATSVLKPDRLLPGLMPRRTQSTVYGLERLLESVERVMAATN